MTKIAASKMRSAAPESVMFCERIACAAFAVAVVALVAPAAVVLPAALPIMVAPAARNGFTEPTFMAAPPFFCLKLSVELLIMSP